MKLRTTLIVFFIITSFISKAQTLSEEETKLYNLIMQYRSGFNLPRIPLSKSLTIVAQTHVKDLAHNKPNVNGCNMHSWSPNGKWTPVCYTADHAQAKYMWSKPKELTSYKGDGFEISYGIDDANLYAEAEKAFISWKSSSGHNSVIINEGIWSNMQWNAIGIGIYKNYAVVWFGKEEDRE